MAIVALIVIGVGIAFIVLNMVVGGHREVMNATDAGALNTAKEALKTPSVNVNDINAAEFAGLGLNNADDISLITYNRAVAAAFLLASNEKEISQEGGSTAGSSYESLKRLGEALTGKLTNGLDLSVAFDRIATAHNAKMLGKNASVALSEQMKCAWLRPGSSTNVYFNPLTLPEGVDISSCLNTDSAYRRSSTGQPFLKGYVPLSLPGLPTIYGVPVFPGNPPHLISNDLSSQPQFNGPVAQTPPNAFSGKGGAQAQRINGFLTALSSAIVGCLESEYPAKLPRGYLKFVNKPGIELPAKWDLVYTDGANDLFNKELYVGPGTYQRDGGIAEGVGGVFCTSLQQMNELIEWNKKRAQGIPVPPVEMFLAEPYDFRRGKELGRKATAAELMGTYELNCHCTHLMYDGTLPRTQTVTVYINIPGDGGTMAQQVVSHPCVGGLPTWSENYGRDIAGDIAAGKARRITDRNNYAAVEYMRTGVNATRAIADDYLFMAHEQLELPTATTGIRIVDRNSRLPLRDFGLKCGRDASPWELLEHFRTATSGGQELEKRILRRASQIAPELSLNELKGILNSKKLGLGKTMYFYNGADGQPLLSETPPPNYDDRAAAPPGTVTGTTAFEYELNGKSVNPLQDIGFLDKPYSGIKDVSTGQQNSVLAADKVQWVLGTGRKGFLGSCEFEQSVHGARVCQAN
ncbi:MAG TPA: hypothetical protein V6D17_21345 [Candidatus Obscuribacterales bacterium]